MNRGCIKEGDNFMEWKDKTYLIAGASSGIGEAVARRFDALGATVILVARREDKLQKICQSLSENSSYIVYDLRDTNHVNDLLEEVIKKNGKLDGLVYTAGICRVEAIRSVEYEELMQMMQVNTLSFFSLCQYFSKVKYSQKGASIVALSSYAAESVEKGMCGYAMSKAALNTEVSVMAKEFLKRLIRVNAIMPANVLNKMAVEENVWTDEEIEMFNQVQPLGVIPVEQVVNCVEFLISDKSSFITGETISISGGYKFNN